MRRLTTNTCLIGVFAAVFLCCQVQQSVGFSFSRNEQNSHAQKNHFLRRRGRRKSALIEIQSSHDNSKNEKWWADEMRFLEDEMMDGFSMSVDEGGADDEVSSFVACGITCAQAVPYQYCLIHNLTHVFCIA